MESGQPRLIKGLQAEFIPAIYRGVNTSGFRAFGKNVVVQVDAASAVSSGGVIVGTDEAVDRMTMNATTGCIFQVGPEAFRNFDDGTTWVGPKPQVGDRIYFEKYAGQIQRGVDGKDYRVMDYRCIAAGVDMDNPEVAEAMAEFQAQVDAPLAAVEPISLNRRARRAREAKKA